MKKILVIVALSLALIIPMSACRSLLDTSVPKKEIFDYVNANYEKLEVFSERQIPKDPTVEKSFINNNLGKDTIVDGVYSYNENIVQFSCGGFGLATGSEYTGFYYSKNNTPFAMEFEKHELTEISPGVFEWIGQDRESGHSFHTERIRENWFYFFQEYY